MKISDVVLEKYANEFRVQHGIGAYDPIRLKSLLAALNVITVFMPITDGFSGMAIKVKEGNEDLRFMLVNNTHSLGRQHFTMCHELYHLYVQKEFTAMNCFTGTFKGSGQEHNADVFASMVLLPTAGVKRLIPEIELGKDKITLKTILKIENFYSTSRTALLYRLKKLQLITAKSYERFNKNIIRSAVEHGYSTDLYKPGNENAIIGDYGVMARELFEREKISETHYISLLRELNINIDETFVEDGEE